MSFPPLDGVKVDLTVSSTRWTLLIFRRVSTFGMVILTLDARTRWGSVLTESTFTCVDIVCSTL